MVILYRLIVNNPNFGTVQNWPPQIKESSWFTELKKVTVNWTDSTEMKTTTTRVAYFSSVSEFETWMNANRLTDSTLISALNEWKSTYSITMEEQYSELPVYTPSITGLLG